MSTLLEREDALRLAESVLAQAQQGHGATLLVTGEAGIGKSSLIRELLVRTQARLRLRVLAGGCEDLISPRPLGPLRDVALQQRGALLESLLAGAPAADVFAAFFEMLDTSVICSLVVFEDIHWADQATLDLIKFLGRRIDELPVVLLLSYRDDEVGADHALQRVIGDMPAAQRIELKPLSAAAVTELAAGAGWPDEDLHAAIGGNPFYVTEVLAGGVGAARQGIPSAVRGAVLARLARLDARQRAVIQVLSVVPGQVEWWLARALLPPADMDAIDACVALGLLEVRNDALAFRHELARRATADAMAPTQRMALHARVLAALLAPPPGLSAALPRLVHHAAEAGDASQVLELAPRAAREAAALGAHREAALQYGVALRFVNSAPQELQAQLYESWSYEAGIALVIDAQVVDARHRAIERWRALGRVEKVGHNLRWLSRLHWYLGNQALAEQYAEEAVALLEPLPPGIELAWAYSVRSQLYMLQDRTDLAVQWGERAITLADQLGAAEIRCHALNNVGTAQLFSNRPGGHDKLEQSLALALAGGFHEQAARVYTNLSEHAVVFKDYARAERVLAEGIAFDRRHDLAAWTHYLVGWLAQLRLEQGRFDEAERIAREVLARSGQTVVMRLPALTVLGRVLMRRGDPQARECLAQARSHARATGESQRVVPVATALAEGAWLRGDMADGLAALKLVAGLPGLGVNPWEQGEVAAWTRRCGAAGSDPLAPALPWRLELDGLARASAQAWRALGAPNEAALALLQVPRLEPQVDPLPALTEALQLFEQLGANPGIARTRSLARELGLPSKLPAPRRGHYGAARSHAQGLTAREQQVLAGLVGDLGNSEMAQQLGVSVRTVERHVSAVLGKLGAADRRAAVALSKRASTPPD